MAGLNDNQRVWALFSGGKDSITTAHVLSSKGQLDGILFLDTGISIPSLREHIDTVANRFGWELKVYRTSYSYEDLVLRYGFPGPAMHSLFMNYLKGRPIRSFWKDHHIPLASGVRRGESHRRFGSAKPMTLYERHIPIHAPILDWSTEKVWAYVREHNLPLSPSYQELHYSGDCLCGAFARRGELHLIRTFYPDLFKRILELERLAKSEGVKRCRWGNTSAEGVASQTRLCFECVGGV